MAFKGARERWARGGVDGVGRLAPLASQMRSERELRRLMQRRAMEGEYRGRAGDLRWAVKLKELNYLSDARFAAEYTAAAQRGGEIRRRREQDLKGGAWRRRRWARRWARRTRASTRWRWRGSTLRASE